MSHGRSNGGYPPQQHQYNPQSPNGLTLPSIGTYTVNYSQVPGGGYAPSGQQAYPHDPYRAPPPGQYPPGQAPQYQNAQYSQYNMPPGYGPPPGQPAYPQSAPRQRTAIACRYCRRRKIRCSGFGPDESREGRCTNCIRFSQECVFTPVSAQTQAFVPAHALYANMRPGPDGTMQMPPGTQLYGAHGQPLGPAQSPQPGQDYYGYAQQGYAPQQAYQQQYEEYSPEPEGGWPQEGLPEERLQAPVPDRGRDNNPMSINNIMDNGPDDRQMLGRLDRRGEHRREQSRGHRSHR